MARTAEIVVSDWSRGVLRRPAMPSSVIRNFCYKNEGLEIEFVSGRRYRYLGVPELLFQEMQRSFSKGEFFNARIRDRFEFERIESSAR